jgi:hypothetical protein
MVQKSPVRSVAQGPDFESGETFNSADYPRHLENYVLPTLGSTEVRLIQTENIQLIHSGLRSQVSPRTIWNVKATVSMMWRVAKAWSHTEEDVSHGLDLPNVPGPRQPFLTAAQMGRIIRNAAKAQATLY